MSLKSEGAYSRRGQGKESRQAFDDVRYLQVCVKGLVRNKVLTYTSRHMSGFANVIGITSNRSQFIHHVQGGPQWHKEALWHNPDRLF